MDTTPENVVSSRWILEKYFPKPAVVIIPFTALFFLQNSLKASIYVIFSQPLLSLDLSWQLSHALASLSATSPPFHLHFLLFVAVVSLGLSIIYFLNISFLELYKICVCVTVVYILITYRLHYLLWYIGGGSNDHPPTFDPTNLVVRRP